MTVTTDIGFVAPEPGLTREELVRRARALRPRLLADQDTVETDGRHSPEMHQAFAESGFYRMLRPRRFGGYEVDIKTYVQVVMEIARGCPGTAWCLALASAHSVPLAAWFSETAQAEAFAPDVEFAAPTRAVPRGTVRPVDGGWRVDGTWDYCSGSPYSTHALVWARVAGDGPQAGRTKLALVPRSGWTLLDDWRDRAFGMRGSGSNSIEIDGAVVPAHFVIDDPYPYGENAQTPGFLLHDNPMYAVEPGMLGPLEINAVLVGTARAALDEYERILRTKKAPGGISGPSGNVIDATLSETHDFQRWFGLATARVEAAERLLLGVSEDLTRACVEATTDGRGWKWEDVGRFNLVRHQSIELGWQAVDLMYRTSGTSEGGRAGSRLNRYYRDYSMGRTNIFADEEKFGEDYGRAHFAAPPAR
ncbi:acyl-CoA dehydrogenase family protein [Streptomyces mangrovisoli]|uniref:Acyl-CoA dehydrogenase n=1 Tax=Streptomyces mangrovisoli TaxID=1428628 RepID=A0A1J4NTR2_9ACTN|nr:acyl-CoA dehydrogenase family protein [Streptomyces mangrovisoli]OIJ65498.1 hypothetical protein WN71_023415 [Streptomyces mangrovisoli]